MEQTVCIPNIGPKQRRMRMNLGMIALVLSIAILVVLIYSGVGRWWRLGLFLPLLMSMVGFFQAREKT